MVEKEKDIGKSGQGPDKTVDPYMLRMHMAELHGVEALDQAAENLRNSPSKLDLQTEDQSR